MPSKQPKSPAGRPYKNIDWDEVDDLLVKGCNGAQIAASIGVTPETLYDRCSLERGQKFSHYSQERREKGNSMLHKYQFENAASGNTTMQIWLGKQRLGQKENPGQMIPEEISTAFAEVMRLWADKQLAAKDDQEALNSDEINIISDK